MLIKEIEGILKDIYLIIRKVRIIWNKVDIKIKERFHSRIGFRIIKVPTIINFDINVNKLSLLYC